MRLYDYPVIRRKIKINIEYEAILHKTLNQMAKKIYRVQRIEETVTEVFVQASTRKEAEELAQDFDRDIFQDAKEEVLGARYGSQIVKRPQGRIIHTSEGYIDADDKHVKL
jgi:hypothetical protein